MNNCSKNGGFLSMFYSFIMFVRWFYFLLVVWFCLFFIEENGIGLFGECLIDFMCWVIIFELIVMVLIVM